MLKITIPLHRKENRMTQTQNELIAALEAIEAELEGVLDERAFIRNQVQIRSAANISLNITRDALANVAEDLQPSLTMKHCLRCGHDWYPKGPGRPNICPRPKGCGSQAWDRERDAHTRGPKPKLSAGV